VHVDDEWERTVRGVTRPEQQTLDLELVEGRPGVVAHVRPGRDVPELFVERRERLGGAVREVDDLGRLFRRLEDCADAAAAERDPLLVAMADERVARVHLVVRAVEPKPSEVRG
jgi:hypothetical protein